MKHPTPLSGCVTSIMKEDGSRPGSWQHSDESVQYKGAMGMVRIWRVGLKEYLGLWLFGWVMLFILSRLEACCRVWSKC